MATPAKDKLDLLREKAGDGPVDALLGAIKNAHGNATLARIQLKAKAAPEEDEEMMDEEEMPAKKKGNPFTKKDDEDEVELSPEEMEDLALLAEVVAETVTPAFEAQAERLAALEEFAGQVEKAFEDEKATTKEYNSLKDEVAELRAQLKELTGEQPRKATAGYRASTDTQTITVKDKEQNPGPVGDAAISTFFKDMFKQGGH